MKVRRFKIDTRRRKRLAEIMEEHDVGERDNPGSESSGPESEDTREKAANRRTKDVVDNASRTDDEPGDAELDKGLEENWAAIQERLQTSSSSDPGGRVVPFTRSRNLRWSLGGLVAVAAALALYIVTNRSPGPDEGDYQGYKGTAGSGDVVCKLTPRAAGSALSFGSDGVTFSWPWGEPLTVAGSCSQPGHLHIHLLTGAGGTAYRNLLVPTDDKGFVKTGSGRLSLDPRSGAGTFIFYLTKNPLPDGAALPEKAFAESLAGQPVVWSDFIRFRSVSSQK